MDLVQSKVKDGQIEMVKSLWFEWCLDFELDLIREAEKTTK